MVSHIGLDYQGRRSSAAHVLTHIYSLNLNVIINQDEIISKLLLSKISSNEGKLMKMPEEKEQSKNYIGLIRLPLT
jgi:hypothetical protein